MLEEMGIDFEVMAAHIDEKAIRREDPKELVMAIARAKTDALKSRISKAAILITADQVVVWQGKIREKPENAKEAREFLEGYNVHPVETVGALVVSNLQTGERAEGVDTAIVHFNPFSETDIEWLIADGQVFTLAGGFTIEGNMWERHIKKIEGTRDSVIGLSKDLTQRLISEVAE